MHIVACSRCYVCRFVPLGKVNIAFTFMSLLHLCHILLSLLTTVAKNLFDEWRVTVQKKNNSESHTQKIIFWSYTAISMVLDPELLCCCLVTSVVPTVWDPVDRSPQAPLSMGFSRQEHWSGLPCPPPGDLPHPGIEPRSPSLQAGSLPMSHQGSPQKYTIYHLLNSEFVQILSVVQNTLV